ncbi:ABC transporter substrate-binding protein [Xanthobacter sp. KR7-65]|uniref:ABC transporter substrate-binding protein n=1 Tax=Xanthobacter sp. KR7-65 TaxID=3156612 RepID=UPI0032B5820F
MLNRRRLVLTLAGTAAAPLLAFPARAQATKTLRVTHAVTSLAYIQSYVAEQKGFFAEQGLGAKLIDTGGGGPDVQLVLAGNAEFTVNDGAQVLPALQQGQKLVCVASLLNRCIVNATISKKAAEQVGFHQELPFEPRIKLLKGLRIGVTRAGALTWQLARFNLAAAGLNPDTDAKVVAIGGPPALAAALDNGAIDVMYISMPMGEKLVREGKGFTLVDNAKGEDPRLPYFLMEGLWATLDFIRSNAQLVRATRAAYLKASHFIAQSSPQEVAAVVKPVLGSLGDDVLVDAIGRLKPAVSTTGAVTKAELDATQAVLEMNGFLKRSFTLNEVFDASASN